MKHIRSISQEPRLASLGSLLGGLTGNLSGAETAVILALSALFGNWQNFSAVIADLTKYYSKTPD